MKNEPRLQLQSHKSLIKNAPEHIKKETKVNAKNIKEVDDKNDQWKQLDDSKQEIKTIIETNQNSRWSR